MWDGTGDAVSSGIILAALGRVSAGCGRSISAVAMYGRLIGVTGGVSSRLIIKQKTQQEKYE